ncbi:hypothetical protein [Burkholderia sp. Ac-20365]|uniref:hypothetical protein n=1 Tax=Burkholderia sp. Ac-20365 TaxID=2703897 RepID=UPI00197C6BFD|nr:hypothetical protein [Burkholderia sp. Ac-20365]MBN3761004.1 hypothetical protein [Burkholderia sp. Ac-20365]
MAARKKATGSSAKGTASQKQKAPTAAQKNEIRKRLDSLFTRAVEQKKAAHQQSTAIGRGPLTIGGRNLKKGAAFELFALGCLLHYMREQGFDIEAKNVGPGNTLTFAGGPSMADKSVHSWFCITKKSSPMLEAWVSIEATTISSSLSNGTKPSAKKASAHHHEFDVALFTPLEKEPHRPSYTQLVLGASCKDFLVKKEQVREALGLRMETGRLINAAKTSLCDWFVPKIPVDPASAVVLFSKGSNCEAYAHPVDKLGLYVRQLQPWMAAYSPLKASGSPTGKALKKDNGLAKK